LLPLKPQVEVRGDWEAGLASLLFTVLVGLMVRQWEKRDWKMRDAAWLGFCWGLAVLVHSSLLLAVGLVLAGELWRTGHRGNDGGLLAVWGNTGGSGAAGAGAMGMPELPGTGRLGDHTQQPWAGVVDVESRAGGAGFTEQ
jgi:hypothetical protein